MWLTKNKQARVEMLSIRKTKEVKLVFIFVYHVKFVHNKVVEGYFRISINPTDFLHQVLNNFFP